MLLHFLDTGLKTDGQTVLFLTTISSNFHPLKTTYRCTGAALRKDVSRRLGVVYN
jgi:hypothetical protein